MPDRVLRGRSTAIDQLTASLTRAEADGQGSTILVAGEPGIGKSALLRVVQRHAVARQFAVGFGKADQVSQIAPGAPVLQALHSGPNPVLSEAGFRRLAALYDRPLWLVEAIADLLEERSQHVPVLITVDDLQWADRLSRFALRGLTSRLAGSPVVWAIAARGDPAEVFPDFDVVNGCEGWSTVILDLQPLTDDDVRAIAVDVLGTPPAGRGGDWLRMAGGNPFLTVALAEGFALDQTRGGSGDVMPEALRANVRRRMGLLDVEARSALQLTAVWGRALDITDAVAMLGTDATELAQLMSGAAELGLITDSPDPIEIRHDLIRELIYLDLSRADRAGLHEKCAAHLISVGRNAVEAVPHARAAAERGNQRALRILRRAALECIDAMPRTAAELILEAFNGVLADDPEWLALGGQCAEVLLQTQRGTDAIEVIDRLLKNTGAPEPRARLQILAARALWLIGSVEDLAARVDGELSTSQVSGVLRARLLAVKSLALSRIGTGPEATLAAEHALGRGRELLDRETQLLALQTLGEVATNEGRHVRANELFHQLRITFGPGFLADEITSLQFIDRFDDAQVLLSRVSQGRGQRSTAELPSLIRAQLWQNFKLAQFDAALADAQTLLDVGDELGNYAQRLDARVVMSTVAVVHGDLDRAREIVALAEDELGTKDAVHAPGIILARARIAAAERDFDEGVRLLKPLLASDAALRTYWPRLLDQMRLSAGIAVAARDRAFARAAVDRAADAAGRNPGVACFAGVALQVKGFVLGDLESLAQAVVLLRQSPRPVILATALTDHGALLLRHGERKQAAKQLSAAWAIFDRLRAAPARSQVQMMLASADPGSTAPRRRRSRPVTGWGALTGTEVLVAQLVGGGRTNRSAADSLGISTNTVAAHLRSIFLKMDVHSRVQLVNAMPPASRGS